MNDQQRAHTAAIISGRMAERGNREQARYWAKRAQEFAQRAREERA